MTSSEAGTEGGTTVAPGVNGSRARPAVRPGPGQDAGDGQLAYRCAEAATLKSAWYRLQPTGSSGGRALRCWCCRRRDGSTRAKSRCSGRPIRRLPTTNPGGAIGFGDVGRRRHGETCVRRWLLCPRMRLRSASSPTTTICPRSTGSRSPRRASRSARCKTWWVRPSRCCSDWLVGLAFLCQRPFDHQNGVIEPPKWRILPDRFGAEANSPVMDNVGEDRWASASCCSARSLFPRI